MKNKKVENTIMLIILIRGIFLLFFNKISITDLLLGSILGLFLIIIYQKLNLKKYKLFQIILLLFLMIFSSYILYNTSYFIKNNILNSYSYIIISFTLLGLCLYITIQGYHSYIKIIELSFYIILATFIISTILLIPYIDLNNLNVINYSFSINSFKFAFNILLIFICINYVNNYQINYKFYSISIINIIFIKLFTTLILSETLENVFNYPYISIFKKISFFDFIERLENFLSLQYLFDYVFILTILILTIKFIIYNLFKFKKNKTLNIVLFSISFIILFFSLIFKF